MLGVLALSETLGGIAAWTGRNVLLSCDVLLRVVGELAAEVEMLAAAPSAAGEIEGGSLLPCW